MTGAARGSTAIGTPTRLKTLYLGLAKDLASRFAQHNSLNGNKPNKGNKGAQINAWFHTHDRLGFSIVIQEGLADDGYGRYSANAEGQLLEGYRVLHGRFPPWNGIGGSRNGATFAGANTAAWFDAMTGRTDSLFIARRTIRDLNDDYEADRYECTMHTSRTELTLHPHQGPIDDAGILNGVRLMAERLISYPGTEDYATLRAYLLQSAPHPESAPPSPTGLGDTHT